MSPLYATPPHSPSSDISSPGQHPPNFEEISVGGGGGVSVITSNTNNVSNINIQQMKLPTDHFARDTHMRIILGNNKETNQASR